MSEIKRQHKDLLTVAGVRAFVKDICKQAVRPVNVYHLMVNSQFQFKQAQAVIPYLKSLGIDTLYLSPFFQAVPGSLHGYNCTDPNQINSEIGTVEEFYRFSETLKQHGMHLVADVVPNHMGISGNGNSWWLDVLENGPSSVYAPFFDIDWDPEKKELKDKVLLPVLGDHYGKILEEGEIRLEFNSREFKLRYWDHLFPVAPGTYPQVLEYGTQELQDSLGTEDKDYLEYLSVITAFRNLPARTTQHPEKIDERNREKEIAKDRLENLVNKSEAVRNFLEGRVRLFNGEKGHPRSFDLLDELVNVQPYRLAHWRVASEEINYRRFFDINELAAIRIEDSRVFNTHHRLLFELVHDGKIQGLRIDHPDGLYDPPVYFQKLQRTFLWKALEKEYERIYQKELLKDSEEAKVLDHYLERVLHEKKMLEAKPLYVVAEKILDRKESLPKDWNIHGTVGYEYLNALNGVFVDRENAQKFQEIYEEFSGLKIDFDQLVYEKKKFFALVHMSSEINTLAHRLDQISETDRRYRDFTRNHLAVAIREVIACFPVYRTYISPDVTQISERDEKYIHIAIEKAKRKTPALSNALYDFLRDVLILKIVPEMFSDEERMYRDFVLRFQQLTGPVMAKGLEDTCFYIYNRLISLNEVGGDPLHFGMSAGDFHRQNQERQRKWPESFITSSTHDTKRSEDVRMRINVLSEIPEEWKATLTKWAVTNEKHKTKIGGSLEPDRNVEYFIYQTLVGVWPIEGVCPEAEEAFKERIWIYMEKALREAKGKTNWINSNTEYEEAVKKFVYGILGRGEGNFFLEVFLPFQQRISMAGMLGLLSALCLKFGSPGAIDTFQGTESWNLRLVDPDNRYPVDFGGCEAKLNQILASMSSSASREEALGAFLSKWEDHGIKLWLLREGLGLRRKMAELLIEGDYLPLKISGKKDKHIVAYLRRMKGQCVIFAAMRFFMEALTEGGALTPHREWWQDTVLVLPQDISENCLEDYLLQKEIPIHTEGDEKVIRAGELFSRLPLSILTQNTSKGNS
ncbi:MAG: malto-oligosyltrehalose synthase [Candidatus Omnitrophica bacterium]|nr:malto-oligosyltrehalose synthase [Candidatus Omnitrophota bacterium]